MIDDWAAPCIGDAPASTSRVGPTVDDINPQNYLKDPKLWIFWYLFRIMGNAGFISSTVVLLGSVFRVMDGHTDTTCANESILITS